MVFCTPRRRVLFSSLGLTAAATLAALASLAGCGGSSSPTGPGNGGLPTSHNAGRDCLGCHSFSVAGTVYQADGVSVSPGATVHLTSLPGAATPVDLTLTADATGNIHTNATIDFGAGLTVTASAAGGTARTMSAAVTSGACNHCHVAGTRVRTN